MKNAVIIFIVIISFFACSKEEEQDLKSDYLPLSVGNYWVYQDTDIDSAGNSKISPFLDSIVISCDTVIKGNTYYRYDSYIVNTDRDNDIHFNNSCYYRDSMKYLITNTGEVFFSETNLTDTLRKKNEFNKSDTIYQMTFRMEYQIDQVTVPAGNFNNVLNFKGTIIGNQKYTSFKNPRYISNCYARGIGKIYQTSLYLNYAATTQKKLLRYNIVK